MVLSHFILVFAIPAATLPEFLDFSAQSHCTTLALLVVVSSPHPVVQWGFVIHYDRVWYTLIYIHSHRLALTNIKRTGFLSIGLIAWVLPHQWDSVTRERCHTSLLDGLSWTTCGWQENKFQTQTSQGLLFSDRRIGWHWDSVGRWDWHAISKKFRAWCSLPTSIQIQIPISNSLPSHVIPFTSACRRKKTPTTHIELRGKLNLDVPKIMLDLDPPFGWF